MGRDDELKLGRRACARQAWREAHERLSAADRETPLEAEDLELLATSAYMVGEYGDYLAGLERAHRAHLAADRPLRAARCAFWEGLQLMTQGETGPATGWFGRAQRLVERDGSDCVERGYLALPAVLGHAAAGAWESASAAAAEAAEIAERFGDQDLLYLALHEQGHALVRQGRVKEGLGLLDEAMVAVTAEELSPIVTGLLYCSVIGYCRELYELRRAQEWTAALTEWWQRQPEMVSFTGQCLSHRAEVMEMQGAWPEAIEEARRAAERFELVGDEPAAGGARYREGEIHRLRGDLAAAEEAYRKASRLGWEPQPGLALLRLVQGDREAAAATMGRLVGETREPVRRAGLLPAQVEVMVAAGDVEEAEAACRELGDIAAAGGNEMLAAMSASARGTVDLARGDAGAALQASRQACRGWLDLGAPYEAARARTVVALACRAQGDEEGASLELETARGAFEQLGAAPGVEWIDSLQRPAGAGDHHGLTPRELEVLRLIAAGNSNKQIAAELVISEHTVARHVQNIFVKLAVTSRTAAGAFAHQHGLI